MTARDIVMSAAGNAGDSKTYIEDVFSAYLYTGNGSTQTINNGIDLAGKGGLVWSKRRSSSGANALVDTNRGRAYSLISNDTGAQLTSSAGADFVSFNSNGFTVGPVENIFYNASGSTYASWTFRKAPKFFDIVTYTGNGISNRQISHSLGATPGMVIVKATNGGSGYSWYVWHRGASSNYFRLDSTSGASTDGGFFGNGSVNVPPTDANFTVGDYAGTNQSGLSYIAYIFGHDTTTDGLIQCGSYTTNSLGEGTVNLGWEPQYVLVKAATGSSDWQIFDNMRGFTAQTSTGYGNAQRLKANLGDAEDNSGSFYLTNTGFVDTGALIASGTVIYMAIRRGPMKTPTDGTKVFAPVATSSSTNPLTITTGFPVDLSIAAIRNVAGHWTYATDRLRGGSTSKTVMLHTESTDSEASYNGFGIGYDNNTGIVDSNFIGGSTEPKIYWNFKRAPGFFDVVCYTGDGSYGQVVNHNLGVVPELIISKRRSSGGVNWGVFHSITPTTYKVAYLDLSNASTGAQTYGGTLYVPPTATTVTYAGNGMVNYPSGTTFVNYLFASCPGVSKIGSYSGTGANTTHNIDCGFTNGARFVLIKRTNATGNWYVFDTARGITSGNDPFLALNNTNAENSSFDCITPYSAGFNINDASNVGLNETGGEYIYLAIA